MSSYRRKPAEIVDGDTFKLHKSIQGKKYVRLARIDTPEEGQFGYEKAMNQLKGMIGGKRVKIKPVTVGRRIIADVWADGKHVNQRMKDRGW